MTKPELEDIKNTIAWLLENGDFKDAQTSYNSAMNSINRLDEAINVIQCSTQLKTFKVGDKVCFRNALECEVIEVLEHNFYKCQKFDNVTIKAYVNSLELI